MSKKKSQYTTLAERVATLETDMGWVKKTLEKMDRCISRIDRRVWWILGSVVALGLIAILIALLKP